jgi:hypothetical protein
MDETSFRAQLELAVSDEPPLGLLVGDILRAGRRLRRRRRAGAAATFSAAAVVLVAAVPSLTAGAGHPASQSRPAAAGQPETGTAYIATGSGVVPVSLATNTAAAPIKVAEAISDPFIPSAAATADGRTVYELGGNPGNGGTIVTPIDTATNTAGPATNLGAVEPQDFVIAPDVHSAYVSASEGLYRIDTATHTASKLTDCSAYGCGQMALTPDGKTLYVIEGRTVTVVQTASNTVLTTITLPQSAPGFAFKIAITPDGRTAYVLVQTFNAKPGVNSVVPINVATNTPGAPIKLQASGEADSIVIAPDSQTAYVLGSTDPCSSGPHLSRGASQRDRLRILARYKCVAHQQAEVTPIDIATNQAERAILPEPVTNREWQGESLDMMALTPDGKTLYVLTQQGVIPISTASGTVLPIIDVPRLCTGGTDFAITPDGKTIYVGACITQTEKQGSVTASGVIVGGGVVPISTATNTAGPFINLGQQPVSITFAG